MAIDVREVLVAPSGAAVLLGRPKRKRVLRVTVFLGDGDPVALPDHDWQVIAPAAYLQRFEEQIFDASPGTQFPVEVEVPGEDAESATGRFVADDTLEGALREAVGQAKGQGAGRASRAASSPPGGRGGGNRGGATADGARGGDDLVRRIAAFPIVTQPAGGPVSETSVQRRMDRELRIAMGPLPTQPTADVLLEALRRRTSIVVGDAAADATWRDMPTGIGTVSASDLSGEQASLVSFAEAMRDAVMPIIRDIQPVQVITHPEMVESHRRLLLDRVQKAPETLARPGGWSTVIVKQLARTLREQVRWLGSALRLRSADGTWDVLTPGQEAQVTQMRVVERWIDMLAGELAKVTSRGDLGSGFYLLNQALGVIAGAVAELRSSCEYVQWTPEERDSWIITLEGFGDGSADGALRDEPLAADGDTITFEGLMTWIEDTAATDLPSLIDGSGLPAIDWGRETLATQFAVLDAVLPDDGSFGDDVPPQLRHPLVSEAAIDLKRRVANAATVAQGLLPEGRHAHETTTDR